MFREGNTPSKHRERGAIVTKGGDGEKKLGKEAPILNQSPLTNEKEQGRCILLPTLH